MRRADLRRLAIATIEGRAAFEKHTGRMSTRPLPTIDLDPHDVLRILDEFDSLEARVEAAAKRHRKMHSCGIGWYTMDPRYKGEIATIGPCPTLQALGVTS